MTDPVKEAVERLTDDLSRAREDGLVLTDAPNLRALLAENARLTKLVEEAGEALEPFAEVCERFQLKASDSPHALYGLPADYWLRASLTHKAITGGGEKPEPTAKLHPDFRRGVCTQCGEPKTPYCRCDEDWFFDMDGKP